MKPYYQDDSVTIYHGDCRERPELTFAAVVTDPPYGTQAAMNGYGRNGVTIANDLDLSAFDGFCSSLGTFRGWIAAFCGTRKRREQEAVLMAHGFALVGEAVWDKGRPSLGYTVRYAHEVCLLARRGEVKAVEPLISVMRGKRTTEVMANRHPHEKPVEVMSKLVRFACPIGGVVLDPFMGSGATLVAAKAAGRGAIGFEVNEQYCEMAARRCAQETLILDAA